MDYTEEAHIHSLQYCFKDVEPSAAAYDSFMKVVHLHVMHLQKELSELKKENEELKASYKNLNEYNDKTCADLESQLSEAKELLRGINLDSRDIVQWSQRKKIELFLKS